MKLTRSMSVVLGSAFACALQAGAAQAAMKTQITDYKHGDTQMSGYFVYDDSVKTKRPAIFMQPDWKGVCADTIARRASFAPVMPGSDSMVKRAAKCANESSKPRLRSASSIVWRSVWWSDFSRKPTTCAGLSSFSELAYASGFLGITDCHVSDS